MAFNIFRVNPAFRTRLLFLLIILNFSCVEGFPQLVNDSIKNDLNYKSVTAGIQYKKSSFHQWLWGKHYRPDWSKSVKVRIINLDTVDGGLTAYEKGGGRQTKTLRLRNTQGKEYVLRSIDKSFGKALPEIYHGTFIEAIINDQVSIAQPYAAITIPMMAEAAGIYHTKPQIVFVPKQKSLGEFNEETGNDLYLLEQRPDENWEEAANFGYAKNIIGSEKLFEKVFEKSDHRVDQTGFVRARLFDMFIGDWGRHDDQWRWAAFKDEDGDKTIYKPVPRDRDQAYTKFDGVLLSLGISAAGAGHLESFGPTIKNVASYNFPARNLDRQLANEPSMQEWITIARELQQSLSDHIIEESVKLLPPEIFPLSGEKIIVNLKSRRDQLVNFATDYYTFLAKEVEVVGTYGNEFFEIKQLNENETEVIVYDLNNEGQPKKNPFYSRKFLRTETQAIRIYGLAGNDQYSLDNKVKNKINIRIIGGPDKDVYTATSLNRNTAHIYDNAQNDFAKAGVVKKHLSEDSSIHEYIYDDYKYNKKGISPSLYYSSEDHIYTGLKYQFEKQKWRKSPFGYKHSLGLRYSIMEKAFAADYYSLFTRLIGNWDLALTANYDFIRWNNFYGFGNETVIASKARNYHRVRSREFFTSVGVERNFTKHHKLNLAVFYQTVKIITDENRFLIEKMPALIPDNQKKYGGAKLNYSFQKLDDQLVPMKGLKFSAGIIHSQNLEQSDSAVTNYFSAINFYLRLSRSFVLSVKTGAATLTGKPEFYQMSRLTSNKTLRGFRRYRFYGRTMMYNQNELQFIKNVKSYLFSGKIGIIALYDIGRVWQPGENSNVWHQGYGGGIMLAPFNKVSVTLFYALSRNERDFSVRVTTPL